MKKKIIILVALAAIIFLFAFFLRDILIPLFRLQNQNDLEGAKELLLSRGIFGGIAVILAICLFVILWVFLNRIYFKEGDGTPDSALYYLGFRIIRLLRKKRQRLHIDDEKLKGLSPPFIVLVNHESFYDFYYISELLSAYNPAYVLNQHYADVPVMRTLVKKTGMISKMLFTSDRAAFHIVKTFQAGYPVVIFPEGRLSVDGRNYPIVEDASVVYQYLKTDLVIARISGAYFSCPKWRNAFFRSDIYVSVKTVIPKEEVCRISSKELGVRISEEMIYNESEAPFNVYHRKNRAKGLENILYRCADCGSLYTTKTKNADLYCTACGRVHHLDETYLFTDGMESIPAYYDRIKEMERKELDDTALTADVKVKIFSRGKPRVRKERGVCTLTREAFHYRSENIEFTKDTGSLPALAFSCNKEFELYHDQEEYYFYPVSNPQQVARWALFIDLLREESCQIKKKND